MKYLACILRLSIIIIWICMIVKNPTIWTPPFLSWTAFILIWLHMAIIAIKWWDSAKCPFVK